MLGQLSNPWWLFIILGLLAGIISGLLGLGSGTIVVPALVILCAVSQKSAQGTALAVMVPMALLGAFRYWKNPEIELSMPIITLIVCGAMVGVLLGTELAARLPAHILRKVFATFLVFVAIRMFVGSSAAKENNPENGSTPASTVAEPGGNSNE